MNSITQICLTCGGGVNGNCVCDKRRMAICLVDNERNRQTELWGDVYYDSYSQAICTLGEEFGELCEAINETLSSKPKRPELAGIDNIIKEATQVAAVAVKFIEQLIMEQSNKEDSEDV